MNPEYDPEKPSVRNSVRQLGPGYCLAGLTQWMCLEMGLSVGSQQQIGAELRVRESGAGPGNLVRFMERRGVGTFDIRNARQQDLVDLLKIAPERLCLMICIWDARLLVGERYHGVDRADTHFLGVLWSGECVVTSSRTKILGEESKVKYPVPDCLEPKTRRVFDVFDVSNGWSGIWRYTEEALQQCWRSSENIRTPKFHGPWLMGVGWSGSEMNKHLTNYRKQRKLVRKLLD